MNQKLFTISLFLLIFTSCGGDGNQIEYKRVSLDIENLTVTKLDNGQKDIIDINIDDSKEAYMILTNKSDIKQDIKLIGDDANNKVTILENSNENKGIKSKISDFNHAPIKKENYDMEKYSTKNNGSSDTEIFYLEIDDSISTKATLRGIKERVKTKYGYKTLKIWVSDDDFGNDCLKLYCVQQNMVDQLLDKFLQEGEDNDIYDWVTDIFGEEWSESNNSSLIGDEDEISILLTDIDNDNRLIGGVLAYFYAKDNYKSRVYNGSNEKVMFYMDSIVFASNSIDEEWDMNNYRQRKILSTLVHEFVHMIQFYQKNVVYNGGHGGLMPWIDEMLAVTAGDLLATRLKTDGFRGVPYYRGDAGDANNSSYAISTFNLHIDSTLTIWNNKIEDYYKVGAFGAYLIRNYGGAKLLHDITHSRYTDKKAIEYAVQQSPNGYNKNFETIMNDWGIAILLSSNTNLDINGGYIYNTGDFISSEYNGKIYDMGSINFYNYKNKPTIQNNIETVKPNANFYYKIDGNITFIGNPNIIVSVVQIIYD